MLLHSTAKFRNLLIVHVFLKNNAVIERTVLNLVRL
eukprot:SAG31_NODE_4581_length_3120_cov_2.891096_1_plen_36_part_00